MKNIIFNQTKIEELCQTLNNASDEIYRNLKQIDILLTTLPETFYDANTKKICEEIKDNKIVILKEYAGRLLNMQKFLIKMKEAYSYLDTEIK